MVTAMPSYDRAAERRDGVSWRRLLWVAPLTEAGVTFEIAVYPNTGHAFHNDTGARWNEAQALAAWNDTVAWFERYVKGA